MIVPNLLVDDLQASVAFYTKHLGFSVMMVLTADNQMTDDPAHPRATFATLSWGDHQLMLQTRSHLESSDANQAFNRPMLSGSLYLRDYEWDAIVDGLPDGSMVAGPTVQWYGMAEIVVRDPDGYTLVLGHKEGAPPL